MKSLRTRHPWWPVVAGYAALTVLMTWPLATRLDTSIAGDLGDPLFVAWVMGWVADHLTRVLTGDLAAWAAMWNTPIFAPEPATLTYSEHFIAQAIQALPVWWVTGNPLLAYNVVYLATVMLTAVAAHGFTVHLSGRHVAGVAAAVLCAFNEYRTVWTVSHLQILSIHWWIVALWGLDVFVARRSRAALYAATAALIAMHLSSSYLLAYGAPFTAAFAVWSLVRHGQWRDRSAWTGVVAAGAVSVLAVLPLLRRYLATRDALGFSRTLPELVGNAATPAIYAEALPWLGPFLALAIVGTLAPAAADRPSRAARCALLAMAAMAFALALGPVIRFGGSDVPGPYALLWAYVPGFEGLRVPHRFAAIGATLLAVLGGIGSAWLWRWWAGRAAVAVAIALVIRHAGPPFPTDVPMPVTAMAPPSGYLRPDVTAPPIYHFVAATGPDAVLVEFPFGEQAYEIRYTYFTGLHRQRTLNGYSGVLPPSFIAREAVLRTPLADRAASWAAIAGATHVVVHTGAWLDDTGARISEWLESHDARIVTTVDGAVLYELPRN